MSKLQEESMPLCAGFSELARSFLISQLDQAERRLIAVDEDHLDISFVYCGMHLVEELYEEIFVQILIGHENMDPGAFLFRIRRQIKLREDVFDG